MIYPLQKCSRSLQIALICIFAILCLSKGIFSLTYGSGLYKRPFPNIFWKVGLWREKISRKASLDEVGSIVLPINSCDAVLISCDAILYEIKPGHFFRCLRRSYTTHDTSQCETNPGPFFIFLCSCVFIIFFWILN